MNLKSRGLLCRQSTASITGMTGVEACITSLQANSASKSVVLPLPHIPLFRKRATSERPFSLFRRGRDSNPCALSRKLISSQPRYDHFDTSPYSVVTRRNPKVRCRMRKMRCYDRFDTSPYRYSITHPPGLCKGFLKKPAKKLSKISERGCVILGHRGSASRPAGSPEAEPIPRVLPQTRGEDSALCPGVRIRVRQDPAGIVPGIRVVRG